MWRRAGVSCLDTIALGYGSYWACFALILYTSANLGRRPGGRYVTRVAMYSRQARLRNPFFIEPVRIIPISQGRGSWRASSNAITPRPWGQPGCGWVLVIAVGGQCFPFVGPPFSDFYVNKGAVSLTDTCAYTHSHSLPPSVDMRTSPSSPFIPSIYRRSWEHQIF
ncbi:uncharacterized protein F4807DRAFT_443128 [Annulohypoxylon truncatum]|uniref:uncharacterized protein n=1 Tax=Annulohypoxylon truncatum TaxID=327061 RepID=UPI00200894DD|nr:uncharacterized protein F4807DRAFT_443128 [Annulohypoxylon truncatum]KAI1205384.1 hypothetical protein F4807DRAFT_443128 [Annulohypoxylon truncatum]